MSLQRQAGNRAVSALVQRLVPTGASGDADVVPVRSASPTPVSVPSFSWTASRPQWHGAQGLVGPTEQLPAQIQQAAGGRFGVLGFTSFPGNARAPQFDFGTVSATPPGGGPPGFRSTPVWKSHSYEGDIVCWYTPPGLHETGRQDGKTVVIGVTPEVSSLAAQAEAEHSTDTKHARDLSIGQAESVLEHHIIGKTFAGTTPAGAEQKVLDEIAAKLPYPPLGNDQSRWAAAYEMLYRKTGIRDTNNWHLFTTVDYREYSDQVVYKLGPASTTSINRTASPALIAY